MGFALSKLNVFSNSFSGNAIPSRCSKIGGNVSPYLGWEKIPDETKSFALICHDPDAPLIFNGQCGFVHWVLYNIPKIASLPENTDIRRFWARGMKQQIIDYLHRDSGELSPFLQLAIRQLDGC